MPTKLERADRIIRAGYKSAKTSLGRSQIDAIHLCIEGYAEPGYADPESGIIAFGNWNRVTKYKSGTFVTIDNAPDRVAEKLQKLGVELEWSDEWDFCKACRKAFRIKPNCYSWQQHAIDDGSGTTICGKCVQDDPTNHLRCLEGRSDACLTLNIDLTQLDYVLLEERFEIGLYGGQSANPALIADAVTDQGVERFLFKLDATRQFDTEFSLWVHKSELTKLDQEQFSAAPKNGHDHAAGLRDSLADASRKMNAIDGQIKVATCDLSTGTATVRTVTPQEFVDGKAFQS